MSKSTRQHAERVLRSYSPREVRLLRNIARERDCWKHVDWAVVDSGLSGGQSGPNSRPAQSQGPQARFEGL